jgi:hypothetical protein
MHPIKNMTPTMPKGGYNKAMRLEKPINEKGIDSSIMINTHVV